MPTRGAPSPLNDPERCSSGILSSMSAIKWKGKSDPDRPQHFYTKELLTALRSVESIYKGCFASEFA